MRVPRESPGQWTCDYCGITRCWATRSTCYRCGEARGYTEELKRHYPNVTREARENGTSNTSAPVASASVSLPWAAKAPPPRSVLPRASSDTAPWLLPSQSRKWTRSTIRTRPLFFERHWRCLRIATFRRVFSMKFGKFVPPHRPPPRRQPQVSRGQIVLNMKKRVEKEEQELRERKTALELARKIAEDKQQKVLEQATVVSDLKMQLVELRQDIANNPTPEVSEDEDATPQAAPLAAPPVPPLAPPPGAPPENTPLDPAGDDMDDDLLEEVNAPAAESLFVRRLLTFKH